MPLPMQPPMAQWLDANGHPYAGGSVQTLIPGTDTAKDTWVDNAGSVLNTNPIILDSAGRCFLLGSGEYRLIVRDADGNLVYDAWTSSVVSTAMQPVMAAASIADAQALLGIVDSSAALNAEVARAQAAEASLRTDLNSEIARAEGIEAGLRSDLNAEINRATSAEAALAAQIAAAVAVKSGSAVTDGSGHVRVTYDTAFASHTIAVVATVAVAGNHGAFMNATVDAAGFDMWTTAPGGTEVPIAAAFYWIATGN